MMWEVEEQNHFAIVREEADGAHEPPAIIAEVIDRQHAHLVAAAPDLLAAARLALPALEHIDDEITQALRAAIEKAEEESEL